MRYKYLAFLASAFLLAPSVACAAEDQQSMPTGFDKLKPVEIVSQAERFHPSGLYVLASKLMEEGRKDEAVRWFYIGQLRYRLHLLSKPSTLADDQTLFAALNESVGRPINKYAFGDVDVAAAQIDAALEWDAAHPNYFTPKDRFPEELAELRAGLQALRDHMVVHKDQIRKVRTRNDLENR